MMRAIRYRAEASKDKPYVRLYDADQPRGVSLADLKVVVINEVCADDGKMNSPEDGLRTMIEVAQWVADRVNAASE